MAAYEMTLAGKKYVLASPIQREPIPELAQQMRMGPAEYADRQGSQFWVWEDFSGGIGLEVMDTRNPDHHNRSWCATGIDTRFPSNTTLGPKIQAGPTWVGIQATANPNAGRWLDIPGALLFAAPTVSWACEVQKTTGLTWTSVLRTNTAGGNQGVDWAFPVPDDTDNQLMYLGTGAELYTSADGTTFTERGTNFPARGIGYDFGEELLICQKTKADGNLYTITGHPTTPAATKMAFMGGLVGDIVPFYDSEGSFVPYVSAYIATTGDVAGKPLASLYVLDPIEEKLYPVADAPPPETAPASGQTYQNLCVWNGWLYMFIGSNLFRYQPGRWEKVGKLEYAVGTIRGIAKTPQWLYVTTSLGLYAVGPNGDWHQLTVSSLGNWGPVAYSANWSPPRIWATTRTAGWAKYFNLPLDVERPSQDSTYEYHYSVFNALVLPYFDGGFSEIEGIALRLTAILDWAGTGASISPRIDFSYNVLGGGNVALGGVTWPATSKSWDFGSGVGVPFNLISLRSDWVLDPANYTVSPILRRLIFQYIKKAPLRYRYTASILMKATKTGLRQAETVLTDLQTAYEATTLQALAYGRVASNVNITSIRQIERPPAGPFKTGQRNVYQLEVVMEEPI